MASPVSRLKSVLNLKHKCIHICNIEPKVVRIHSFGESFDQLQMFVHARPYKRLQCCCPVCRRKCAGYDQKRDVPSRWRASNLNGVPVYICYQPHRIECPEHGVLTEHIPWADGTSRFTEDFNNEISWMACRMSKSCIARLEVINWRTVGNCIKAAQSRLEPDPSARMRDLKRICVDETSYHKGYAYITVVYDMDRNRAVWVHEGNGLETFRLFCEELPEQERSKIKIVAGDGAQWIDTCVKQYFPNATRCIDFFHVAEWANEKLDKVRTETANKARQEYARRKQALHQEELKEQMNLTAARNRVLKQLKTVEKALSAYPKRGRPNRYKKELMDRKKELLSRIPEEPKVQRKPGRPNNEGLSPAHQAELDQLAARRKDIQNSRYALGHNPENRTENQTEKLKLIENSYPDLYRAYQLKETLRLILHMKDAESAKEELDRWIRESAASGLGPMKELSEKIFRHRENILNSIQHQANSAKSGAVNTTIKVLIKMAAAARHTANELRQRRLGTPVTAGPSEPSTVTVLFLSSSPSVEDYAASAWGPRKGDGCV